MALCEHEYIITPFHLIVVSFHTKALGLESYASFDQVPEILRKNIKASFFPPTREELEWMHLERCLR